MPTTQTLDMALVNETNTLQREFQMRFLLEVDCLSPDDRFCDYGCGPGRLGIPLIRYLSFGKYLGLDVDVDSVAWKGWREVKDTGAEIVHFNPDDDPLADFMIGDQRFDVIWAYSVLIHMTDERLDNFFRFVKKRLRVAGSRAFANVNLGLRPEENWNGFPVVWRTLDDIRQRARSHGLRTYNLGSLSEFGQMIRRADEQHMLLFLPIL